MERKAAGLNLISLKRDRVDNRAVRHLRLELRHEPGPGGGIAVGKHDTTRFSLDGELDELLAIGVTAEFEAFHPSFDFGFNVGRLKEEGIARSSREQFAARSFGIAVADEADGVAGIAEKARGEGITGRALDEHTGADDVERVLPGVLASHEFAGRRLNFEIFDDAAIKLNVLRLAADLVEIICEIHAETGRKNREVYQFAEFAGVVDDREDFLHATEREHGNKEGAAALNRVVDAGDQAEHLLGAALAERSFRGAARGFGDNRIKMSGRKTCTFERALIGEKDVTGEKDGAVFVDEFDGGGAGDVAGRVKHDLDFVFGPTEVFGLIEIQADHAFAAAINFLVRKQRIVGNVGLLALAHHHVGRIVQHALDEHAAGSRHQHRGVGMLAHQDWQAADMVQVAMRDDDEVEGLIANQRQIGRGGPADLFGI